MAEFSLPKHSRITPGKHFPAKGAKNPRHADPIVPEDLDQVALAAPEAEDLTTMRVAAEPLLDLQRQTVHPAAHVRHPARDPHPRTRRKRDHHGSNTASSAAKCDGASNTGIVMRRPFVSVMSIRASSASREGRSAGSGRALSITSGTKPPPASGVLIGAPSVPLRYSRRQIDSSDREIPYRRAVAEPCC